MMPENLTRVGVAKRWLVRVRFELAKLRYPLAALWCAGSFSWNLAAEIRISEFAAAKTNFRDEDGETQDWIEIHNSGPESVNLLGWSITDSAKQPRKWEFPSVMVGRDKFLVLFASGKNRTNSASKKPLHTNFKLEVGGEYLGLFSKDAQTKAVTEFAPQYPEQRTGHSYSVDPGGKWRYSEDATPGASNSTTGFEAITPVPEFSVMRGVFEEPFRLDLKNSPGTAIRYTMDGSEPDRTTGRGYTGPLLITNTAVVRAVALKDGQLPSRVVTHSYIFLNQVLYQPAAPPGFPRTWGRGQGFQGGQIAADYEVDQDPLRVDVNDPRSSIDPEKDRRFKKGLRELPIVSISLLTADMFGVQGLYPTAREAVEKPANEKRCSVELILPDGTPGFSETCAIDLHGNASRNPHKTPKHGFKLEFKEDFGASALKYQLFPDSPAEEFDDLILRPDFGVSWLHWSDSRQNAQGSYQRTRAARFRDAWYKEAFRNMGGTASYNRFCHLFINGLYWGVYDFTEQPTEGFAQNYFGGEKSDYDIIDQGTLRRGTPRALEILSSIDDLEDPALYQILQRFLNVPEFIDYTLLNFFVSHQDWGYQKNWYAIRRRASNAGAFRFIPWDGESVLLELTGNRVEHADTPLGLHMKLSANAEYRLTFADHVFKHMLSAKGALTVSSNLSRWRKFEALLDNAIVCESTRWGDYRRDVHPFAEGRFALYTRETHWLPEVERIATTYFPKRNEIVIGQLNAAGLYPTISAPLFNHDGARGILTMSAPNAKVYYTLDGTDPRQPLTGQPTTGAKLHESPLTVESGAWLKARALNGRTWSALNEAIIEPMGRRTGILISEIMYNPAAENGAEFLQVTNLGPATIDLSFYRIAGVDYIFPDGSVLLPGQSILLSSRTDESTLPRGRREIFGVFGGSLDNGGERISILDRQGRAIATVQYDDTEPWPKEADGKGAWLRVTNAHAANPDGSGWTAVRGD